VPPGDPVQKYRQEVKHYLSRGEVSFVGRKTLDALRSRLGLSASDATAIEDEMLAAARQAFRDKLQQYERDFTEALQQEVALDEADLTALRQNLQHILGLRQEDTRPIEDRVRSRLAAAIQHRQQYQQAFAEALRQEYPLSPATRHRFQQMQQEWQLSDADIAPIESRITADIEAYRQKLQQYAQALATATQQKYFLSEAQRHGLLEEQRGLGLTDEDIAPIEAQMHAEVEAYQQKLQQYEQVVVRAMQDEYPLCEEIRQELQRFQRVLGLEDEEVAHIEASVVQQMASTGVQPTFSPHTPESGHASEPQPPHRTPPASAKHVRVLVGGGLIAIVALVLIYTLLLRSPQPSQYEHTQPHNSTPDSLTTAQMTPTDFNKMGKDKYDARDYQGAIENYAEAIKLDPNDADAYYNRAIARTAQGDMTGALEDHQKAADLGYASAQNYLGEMYANGQGVAKNDLEAGQWYRRAADQGHAAAQYSLGKMYANGRGVAKDDAEAVAWYRKAADQGYAAAQNSLGWMYANGRGVAKDDAEAVAWYRKAADQGHALGQSNLGLMYANGRGVAKDDAEAVAWYRESAAQGNAWGQNNLGVMYQHGRSVTKDHVEAVKWYRKAADQGHAAAQNNLGEMSANGWGVAQDDAEAVAWYRKAADQGYAAAQNNLRRMDERTRGRAQNNEPLKAECPPDELSTLGKVAPLYIQWHKSRHAQWEEDEVKDPILEALVKEEEGQEGAAPGRGRVFQRMLPMLEAADSIKAERVSSGVRASAVLEDLRAGKEARQGDVNKFAKDFRASLTCLSRSLKAIEYLTKLNDMPSFPDPIIDPEGEIGRFLGAYMRRHVIVNHNQWTRQIVLEALNAHKGIQPFAKRSFSTTAGLVLIEKALENLDPKIAAEARQGHGEKARKDFLDGESKLKQRQATATKDYEDSYKILPKEYQEALIALAPESATFPPNQSYEDKGLRKDVPSQQLREPRKQAPPRDPTRWHWETDR
jgi:TPR repeat protein